MPTFPFVQVEGARLAAYSPACLFTRVVWSGSGDVTSRLPASATLFATANPRESRRRIRVHSFLCENVRPCTHIEFASRARRHHGMGQSCFATSHHRGARPIRKVTRGSARRCTIKNPANAGFFVARRNKRPTVLSAPHRAGLSPLRAAVRLPASAAHAIAPVPGPSAR